MKKTVLTSIILLAFALGSVAQQGSFASQGAEWYFNLSSFMGSSISYYHMEVLGDTIIQGHTCSVITQQFLGGNGDKQFVYEEDRVVYWYNQTLQSFTTLYDFDAEEGESWICDIDSCAIQVTVFGVDEVVWGGKSYQTQMVNYSNGEYIVDEGRIIEGIGFEHGLFPYPWACSYSIYDGPYPDYLRCYLVDGELLYHEGEYDCDEIVEVPTPSYPFAVGDLLYQIISDDPPQVSVYGHVAGTAAQGELVIPETVEVGEITYTVTRIGQSAFSGCSGLTGHLTIPNTVTTIAAEAFYECSGFTGDLVIPNSVTELGVGNLWGAFEDCSGFNGHLVLPEGLEVIHDGCFGGCQNLQGELLLPTTLKEIGEYAFYGCSGFTGELVFPDSLNSIGELAFEGCSGFTGRLVFPDALEWIGAEAFFGCSGFTDIELHHQVFYQHNFGEDVFGFWSLIEIDIPEGWTTTGSGTFSYCRNLTTVHLPESLMSIDDYAFYECEKLSEINIPEGVKSIGIYAFEHCTSLTEFNFSPHLTQIGRGAFEYCSGLTGDMIIPDSVEWIQPQTFDSCVGIKRFVFGFSVNHITECAFNYTQPQSLYFKSMTPPELYREPTPDVWYFPIDIPIIVPCGSLEAYQNAEGWSEFTNITEDCGGLPVFNGSEWYYEILNENGSITYQHLEYAADTTVSHKDVKIIIRTNTLYDKSRSTEVTREYVYEEDNKVYWWNKDLQEFTVLYDLGALQGDEWEIKVGMESLTMHVDAVNQYYYDGRLFKLLQVSDEGDLFSGTIVCGIGHLTSFFPERLMTRGKGYRVEGIRCYWREGELVFKYGDKDCDEVYQEYHSSIEDMMEHVFALYPNPTHGVLIVETCHGASLPDQIYHITNLMGQTILTGTITAENQRIDVSKLPQGMYFISIGDLTRKFVVR